MDEVVRTQQEETFGVFGRDVAIYDCMGPRFFAHFAQWLVWQLCCRICIFVIIILAIIGCANTVTSRYSDYSTDTQAPAETIPSPGASQPAQTQPDPRCPDGGRLRINVASRQMSCR